MIRVLIADDHALMREGLKLLLQLAPDVSIVGEAADGREAVAKAQELKPDVVLMDIAMHGLNGIDATRLLHESCPEIRVVMLSMHSDSERVFRAFEAGACGFVLKESAGAEVLNAVRAARAGRQQLSRSLQAVLESGAPAASPLDRLSARERQVLQMVVEGKSSAEIANVLRLSPKTIETYRVRIMAKLGIRDLPNLVKFALQHGLTPPH